MAGEALELKDIRCFLAVADATSRCQRLITRAPELFKQVGRVAAFDG